MSLRGTRDKLRTRVIYGLYLSPTSLARVLKPTLHCIVKFSVTILTWERRTQTGSKRVGTLGTAYSQTLHCQ
jgi:hypothetical protein